MNIIYITGKCIGIKIDVKNILYLIPIWFVIYLSLLSYQGILISLNQVWRGRKRIRVRRPWLSGSEKGLPTKQGTWHEINSRKRYDKEHDKKTTTKTTTTTTTTTIKKTKGTTKN